MFDADGSGFESEIWGDLDVMGPAFNRNTAYTSIVVRLTNPSSLAQFNEDLKRNPAMQVEALEERQFYDNQSGGVSTALLGLGGFVAVVMGVGAIFGAMNTMYGIVAARTREIGTLRALGFSRFSILTAFVIESTFLAIGGRRWLPDRAAGQRHHVVCGRRQLRRSRVRVSDLSLGARRGTDLRNRDGIGRRPAARLEGGANADY